MTIASWLLCQSARIRATLCTTTQRQVEEECNERCDDTAEQSALAADHLFGGDHRQCLVECILSAPMVRAAAVKYPLCARLADDSVIRRPKHFSHPRNAPGGNDCEAGSRYGSPRHGRPLPLYTQSALPRPHDACTGDWTALGL